MANEDLVTAAQRLAEGIAGLKVGIGHFGAMAKVSAMITQALVQERLTLLDSDWDALSAADEEAKKLWEEAKRKRAMEDPE